jgi:ABC-2 type transport system ATP-binding protein
VKEPGVIEVSGLTKSYGRRRAVEGLSFRVLPGRVTGFLGPNGAGKSTTLRLILGLDVPTAGTAAVNGRPFREAGVPLRAVGVLLDAGAVQGDRTARNHLLWLAQANGIAARRVGEVLDLVGLADVAGRRVKGFSLGMAQRLGVAAALIGDAGVLVFDEPINGLDTEGIRWIRGLLKDLAAQGRTVLVSSHVMSEMELTADHLIVIGRGRLIADTPMGEFIERHSRPRTLVRSPHRDRLAAALRERGARVRPEGADGCWVDGLGAVEIGALAAAHRLTLYELTPRRSSLEEVYTELTRPEIEYGHAARTAS